MITKLRTYGILIFSLTAYYLGWCQDMASNDTKDISYNKAHHLAYEGDYKTAHEILLQVLSKNPNDSEARSLLASTYSWKGHYDKARKEFNKITSTKQDNRDVWISAVKNELYAKNEATALGLANKALFYLKDDKEIERLKSIAEERVKNKKYPVLGWYNQESSLSVKSTKSISKEKKADKKEDTLDEDNATIEKVKSTDEKKMENNRFGINNSFTVFSERYDPMVFTSITYKRQTMVGSIIPRINYSNRLGRQGLQYDLDFYPKFSKRLYAYMNYGFSNSSIFPKHRVGGDLYVNLPLAIEFSAGGRYIVTSTRNVTAITNSLGHYRGNYYFSLRSFITPRPDRLTRISGNLLVRKYLRDAENFFGLTVGMGVSPELRQIVADDQLLAETLLFIESQRLNLEYQFTAKKTPNIYRARLGVTRQELVFDSGNFFWGISAGLVYQVKF